MPAITQSDRPKRPPILSNPFTPNPLAPNWLRFALFPLLLKLALFPRKLVCALVTAATWSFLPAPGPARKDHGRHATGADPAHEPIFESESAEPFAREDPEELDELDRRHTIRDDDIGGIVGNFFTKSPTLLPSASRNWRKFLVVYRHGICRG